jgi:hypothetical protein
MHRLLTLTGSSILLVMAAMQQSPAQINPLRLSVTKNRKVAQNTMYQNPGGTARTYETTETISYTIEVANATTAPVADAEVQWAVLVKPRGKTTLEVVEGKQACSLNVGSKFVFETDKLELRGTMRHTTAGQYQFPHSAKIIGYAVEVFIRDVRAAADIQPPDTKRKIEQLKAEKEKPDQKIHRF